MNSLFQDWPSRALAQLYFSEEMPESLKFIKFFRVTDLDVLKAILFFWRRGLCGTVMHSRELVVDRYSRKRTIKSLALELVVRINSF